MKVSDTILQSQIQRAVSARSRALSRLQIAIASGVQYNRRSDNPSATSAASALERSAAANTQWQANVDHVLGWTRVTEGRLTEIVDLMHRADELAVQAGDGTATAADRLRIANEVDAILESLVTVSNARYQGVYLFGGTYSDQPPIQVTRDASGIITAIAPAVPDIPERTAQVDDDTVWGYGATAAGDGGVFLDTVSGNDLFQSVLHVRDTLAAGNVLSDAGKQDVEAGRDHAIARLVGIGIDQQRYESLANRHDLAEVDLTDRLSDVRDLDLARALTELSQLEATYQASLQMAARMNQLKFSDFI